jgi:hypothetical protein
VVRKQRASEHRFARNIVRELKNGLFYFMAADDFAKGSAEQRRASELAKERWSQAMMMILIGAGRSGGEFLRVFADAFDDKLCGAMRDALRAEGYARAIWNGNRKDERSSRLRPFLSEVLDELPAENERTLRRTLKFLSCDLTEKPGHPRGKKNATRTNSKTVAAKKSPLTDAERRIIRDLEWSNVKHASIEREIGRPYKRTDTGELVAV